jgi:hypothetical protein
MRLPILSTALSILLCLFMTLSADAEEYYYNNPEQEDVDQEQDGDMQEWEDDAQQAQTEQPEQEAAQSGDPDEGVLYNRFTVCADAVIEVQDVKIYCDSPGTFYYGSGKYRNSPSCLAGDKAKVLIDFYIAQPDVIQAAGGYVLIDVSASGQSGWYQQNPSIYSSADLCSLSTLKKRSGSGCPYEGKYRIQTSFYWEDVQYEYMRYAFYPSVMVGFKSNAGQRSYDYGGANTDYCGGNTFAVWTRAWRTKYANELSNFFKSFGILLATIVIIGAFVWFLVQKPTSVKDAGEKLGVIKRDIFLEDEFDFSKIQPQHHKGQNLVDF